MSDPVWDEFRRTCVRLTVDGGTLDIEPRADDTPGDFLAGAKGPIQIVTAQNPMGLAASDADNAVANGQLAADLAAFDGCRVWPATGYGGGPLDSVDTWHEEGFAVEGLDRATALELAVRYRQRAIFEWRDEPGGFRLVACDGSADEPRGWTVTFHPTA